MSFDLATFFAEIDNPKKKKKEKKVIAKKTDIQDVIAQDSDYIRVPLVLVGNVAKKDRQSWAWMANQYGVINMKRKMHCVIAPGEKDYMQRIHGRDFAGKQEQRYHMHEPDYNYDRNYQGGNRLDPMKYHDCYAGLRAYSALNFYDDDIRNHFHISYR